MRPCADLGVTASIELPPAGTLAGLAKRELPGRRDRPAEHPGRPGGRAGPDRPRRAAGSRAHEPTPAAGGSSSPRPAARSAAADLAEGSRPPGRSAARLGPHAARGARASAPPTTGYWPSGSPTTATWSPRASRSPASCPARLRMSPMQLQRRSPAPGSSRSAHYQPATGVTNDDLAAGVDTNDEWIREPGRHRRAGGSPAPTRPSSTWPSRAGGKALAAAGLAAGRHRPGHRRHLHDCRRRSRTRPPRSPTGSASRRPARSTSTPPAPASATRWPRADHGDPRRRGRATCW